MADNFWDKDPVAGQAPAQPPARPQGGFIPSPGAERRNAREDAAAALAAEKAAQDTAKNSFRVMTPEEVKAYGLPTGGTYQINGLGEIKEVSAAPKTGTPESTAQNAVVSAGIDLRAKDDRVADLIMRSTSGRRQTFGANLYGDVMGSSTDGMLAIGALKPLVADLVLQATGGSLGAQISDGDRKFIIERMGNIADPEVPADQRLASWNEVKRRLANSLGVPLNEVTFAGEQPAGDAVPQTEGNAAIQAAFDRGASKQELLALAQQLGVSFPGGEARLDEMIAFRDGGGQGATFIPQAPQEDPRVKQLADEWEARNGPAGLTDLATQGITLGFADEAGAVGSTVGRLLRGETDVAGNYQLFTAVERELVRRARERTGGVGTAAELIGGGAGVRALGAGATTVRGALGEGALIGGAAGFGYGEGTQGSLTGAAAGAALGGALGAGVQRLANRGGGSGGGPSGGTGAEAVQAADNLNAATGSNIRLMPADVGGPGIRNVTGGAAKMTLSGEIIGRRAEGLTQEAEKAKDALVALAGGRAENEVAGEVALEGARKWMKSSATKRDALYAKARKMGGDQPVDLANARQVLDGHIAELAQTPGSAVGVERLRSLRAELDQPFPVEGVKRMRTRLRDDFGSDGLRATDIERRVGQVIDAAEDDIITSLQAAGKGDAARAYRQAADAHRERVQVIDEVLAPIIGRKGSDPRSGEQIIRAIEQAAQSNSAKLGRFLNTLPAEDAGVVRGTIIDRLGRASAGQQDAGGNAFSLNTFLTNWSKMSDRAKSSLFGGELRASLEDLAKVANARRESGRSVNFSNTGSTIGNLASGGALMGSVTNPATLGLFAIDGLTGAILSSPKLARWLAKMPANPNAQRKHIEGLSKIAAADSAIAADALGLQRQLLAAFDQGPVSLAAQDQSEGSNTTGPGTQ